MMELDVVTITEYLPCLAEDLVEADTVNVRFEIEPCDGTLNFTMIDTTPWPPGSDGRAVTKDEDGNTCLVVERDRDRIFLLELSPDWRWSYDYEATPTHDPITIKNKNAPYYKVNRVSSNLVEVYAKARAGVPKGKGARDFFNIYVRMEQDSGSPIALRIDPISDNPPDRP